MSESKPPLGLKPRYIWLEERRDDLIAAIERQEQSATPNRKLIEKWRHELFTGEFELEIVEGKPRKSELDRLLESARIMHFDLLALGGIPLAEMVDRFGNK
jgi:hypothetical protein